MRAADRFLYDTIGLPVMIAGLGAVSPFVPKIRRGFSERRGLWKRLQESLSRCPEEAKPRFWFHASSAGEFIQSRPLLEDIRASCPGALIAATYFSPSADRVVKKSPLVDVSSYLPVDTKGNANRMFSLLRPDLVIFSRYDVWPNIVWEACRRNCPAVLINATMSPESSRIRWPAKTFHGRLYSDLELICVTTREDREHFLSIGVPAWKIEVAGDTKYDEVYNRVAAAGVGKSPLKPLSGDGRMVIGGSTWPPDEKILLDAFGEIRKTCPDLSLILVPHEPTARRVRGLTQRILGMGFAVESYSAVTGGGGRIEGKEVDVLIVDEVGPLAGLYGSADIAYVGGGFSSGIHNVLEPASLGVPVIIGPKHRKAPEAISLVRDGGATVVTSAEEAKRSISGLLGDDQRLESMGAAALDSVRKNLGATGRVMAILRTTFPLPI